MTEIERLEERVAAVERAALDGDHDFEDLERLASVVETVERIEDLLADLESRVADLEARTESVEGYVGSVESVNEDVERRAAAAVDATEALEARIEALEGTADPSRPSGDGGSLGDESDTVNEYDGHTGGVDVDERARQILDGNSDGAGSAGTVSVPGPPGVPLGGADTDEPAGTEPGGDGRQGSREAGVARATVADGSGEVATDKGLVRDGSGDDEPGLLASLASRLDRLP